MLYIEDDRRDLWPSVLRVLASLEPLDLVLCLYAGEGPESFTSPFRSPEMNEYLETIARFEDGARPLFSQRIQVDEALLSWLEARTDEFEDWGAYLAVYPPGKYELVAAAIHHEGTIVVADEFGSPLAAAGFRPSGDPPDWW